MSGTGVTKRCTGDSLQDKPSFCANRTAFGQRFAASVRTTPAPRLLPKRRSNPPAATTPPTGVVVDRPQLLPCRDGIAERTRFQRSLGPIDRHRDCDRDRVAQLNEKGHGPCDLQLTCGRRGNQTRRSTTPSVIGESAMRICAPRVKGPRRAMPPKRLHVTVNDGADLVHDKVTEILADDVITTIEFNEFIDVLEECLIAPALVQADAVRFSMIALGHGIEGAWFGRQMREHMEDLEVVQPERLDRARSQAPALALDVA